MNIKVNRVSLITALEKELAKRAEAIAKQDKFDDEYEKASKKRNDDIVKAIQSGKAKVKYDDLRYWGNGNEVNATLVLPAGIPKLPDRQYATPCYPRNQYDELKAAISLLKLSDETNVSASTYKHVAQYLA